MASSIKPKNSQVNSWNPRIVPVSNCQLSRGSSTVISTNVTKSSSKSKTTDSSRLHPQTISNYALNTGIVNDIARQSHKNGGERGDNSQGEVILYSYRDIDSVDSMTEFTDAKEEGISNIRQTSNIELTSNEIIAVHESVVDAIDGNDAETLRPVTGDIENHAEIIDTTDSRNFELIGNNIYDDTCPSLLRVSFANLSEKANDSLIESSSRSLTCNTACISAFDMIEDGLVQSTQRDSEDVGEDEVLETQPEPIEYRTYLTSLDDTVKSIHRPDIGQESADGAIESNACDNLSTSDCVPKGSVLTPQLSPSVVNRFIFDLNDIPTENHNIGDCSCNITPCTCKKSIIKLPSGWTEREIQLKVLDEIKRIQKRSILSEEESVKLIQSALEVNRSKLARDLIVEQPYKDLEQLDRSSFVTGDLNLLTFRSRELLPTKKIGKKSMKTIKSGNKQSITIQKDKSKRKRGKGNKDKAVEQDDLKFSKALDEIERIRSRMINHASMALKKSKSHDMTIIRNEDTSINHLNELELQLQRRLRQTNLPSFRSRINSSRTDVISLSDLFAAYETSPIDARESMEYDHDSDDDLLTIADQENTANNSRRQSIATISIDQSQYLSPPQSMSESLSFSHIYQPREITQESIDREDFDEKLNSFREMNSTKELRPLKFTPKKSIRRNKSGNIPHYKGMTEDYVGYARQIGRLKPIQRQSNTLRESQSSTDMDYHDSSMLISQNIHQSLSQSLISSLSNESRDIKQAQQLLQIPLSDLRKIGQNMSYYSSVQSIDEYGMEDPMKNDYQISKESIELANRITTKNGLDLDSDDERDSSKLLGELYMKLERFDSHLKVPVADDEKDSTILAEGETIRFPSISSNRLQSRAYDKSSSQSGLSNQMHSPNEIIRLPSCAGATMLDSPIPSMEFNNGHDHIQSSTTSNTKALAAAAEAGDAFGKLISSMISKQIKQSTSRK